MRQTMHFQFSRSAARSGVKVQASANIPAAMIGRTLSVSISRPAQPKEFNRTDSAQRVIDISAKTKKPVVQSGKLFGAGESSPIPRSASETGNQENRILDPKPRPSGLGFDKRKLVSTSSGGQQFKQNGGAPRVVQKVLGGYMERNPSPIDKSKLVSAQQGAVNSAPASVRAKSENRIFGGDANKTKGQPIDMRKLVSARAQSTGGHQSSGSNRAESRLVNMRVNIIGRIDLIRKNLREITERLFG